MIGIAHRGASGHELENSMAAFKRAIELGISVIELDVQRTADNHFVVFHDSMLGRCTESGDKISEVSIKYLREEVRLKNGEPIPELFEVCQLFKDNNTTTLIELKNEDSATDVLSIVVEILPWENFIIGSFFHKQIVQLKKSFPQVQTCIMFEGYLLDLPEYLKRAQVNFAAVGFDSASKVMVNEIKKTGVQALVWTVNDPDDIALAKNMRFDGIISNYPERI